MSVFIRGKHYQVESFYSEEDEGWIATVPSLPGCNAFGETKEEAEREILDAAEAWFNAYEAANRPPTVRILLTIALFMGIGAGVAAVLIGNLGL